MKKVDINLHVEAALVTLSMIGAISSNTREKGFNNDLLFSKMLEEFITSYHNVFDVDAMANKIKTIRNHEGILEDAIVNRCRPRQLFRILNKVKRRVGKKQEVKLKILRDDAFMIRYIAETISEYMGTINEVLTIIVDKCNGEVDRFLLWEAELAEDDRKTAEKLYQFKIILKPEPLYADDRFRGGFAILFELMNEKVMIEKTVESFTFV